MILISVNYIVMDDADMDSVHIFTLLLTHFYRFLQKLIYERPYLYWYDSAV